MAIDIEKRLNRLRDRRAGTDRLDRLNRTAMDHVLNRRLEIEPWQKRATNQPFTRYALGAMQEVDAEYTRVSIETAERVGKQLKEGLAAKGWTANFRLQGSVPLNVHIRGVSDVDLLSLDGSYISYMRTGSKALAGFYSGATSETSVQRLQRLRKEAEKILVEKYPAATVDISGGKAIALSGGSLARPVDVVPSHWLDTIAYQASGLERDRGVVILDKKVPETIDNFPFLHIHEIESRCRENTLGGLRKAIRLCKNVKSDAVADGKDIKLPSFDIAAIMYHADRTALHSGYFYELAILAETQRFLDYLYNNQTFALSLYVPDGSRKIFDKQEKLGALRSLSVEIDQLAVEVAREQSIQLRYNAGSISLHEARSALEKVLVPD